MREIVLRRVPLALPVFFAPATTYYFPAPRSGGMK